MTCAPPQLVAFEDSAAMSVVDLAIWLRQACPWCGLLRAECRRDAPAIEAWWYYDALLASSSDPLLLVPFIDRSVEDGDGGRRIGLAQCGPQVPARWAPPSADSWCVYVMWSHGGSCLYVGQSVRLPDRLREHSKVKPWWSELAAIEVWHLGSYAAMCEAENRLIRDLRPQYNVRRPLPVIAVPTPKES